MSYRRTPLSMSAALATTLSRSNSKLPTPVRVSAPNTSSHKERRLERAPWLSQATIGEYLNELTILTSIFIILVARSLVTSLRAAEKFQRSHLLSNGVASLVENAKIYYMEGYMLTHNVSCALYLGEKASTSSKVSNAQSHPF